MKKDNHARRTRNTRVQMERSRKKAERSNETALLKKRVEELELQVRWLTPREYSEEWPIPKGNHAVQESQRTRRRHQVSSKALLAGEDGIT
jgi:hypothetical protein